jgi:hypothetical protein
MKTMAGLLLIFLLCGCATPSKFLANNSPLEPGFGYLYGTFKISGGFFWTLVLEPAKKHAEQLKVRLNRTDRVRVYKAVPGTYRLTKVVFTDALGNIEFGGIVPVSKCAWPQGYSKPFTVEEGKGYFLGNFEGVTWYEMGEFVPGALTWGPRGGAVAPLRYDFEATTTNLKSNYPAFTELPCQAAFPEASGVPHPVPTSKPLKPWQ